MKKSYLYFAVLFVTFLLAGLCQGSTKVDERSQLPPYRFVTSDPCSFDNYPCFSPDGKTLLFCRSAVGRRAWELYIVPVDGGRPSRFVGSSLPVVASLGKEGFKNQSLPPNAVKAISVYRSSSNPLITFESSKSLGENINGPSVIRVPSWVNAPLGKYYMYFSHHSGKYIRMAYANSMDGPWKIYEPGSLRLAQAKAFGDHLASPDMHVENESQEIRMYFHCPAKDRRGQWTGVAISKDGLKFKASEEILGKYYFRVFKWKDYYYAIAKGWISGWGELLRSKDGVMEFERRSNFIHRLRHAAVLLRGNQLLIFYSRKGDAPERILVSTVRLSDDWNEWVESEPIEVIRPEKDYEGIQYPVKPSNYGYAIRVCQLRDPCIFEENGKIYLFYTIAGEMGIAMAELKITMHESANKALQRTPPLSSNVRSFAFGP